MELAAFIHSKSVWVQEISLHCSSKIPLGHLVPTLYSRLFRQFFDYILMRAFHLVASMLIRGLSMKTGSPCLGNTKLDIQHTVTPVEGISQVWNGVATDNDSLSYFTYTLLISFKDKKCLMELKTKYSDQPNKCWESFTWNIMHPLLKKLKRRCVSKP